MTTPENSSSTQPRREFLRQTVAATIAPLAVSTATAATASAQAEATAFLARYEARIDLLGVTCFRCAD